MRKSASVTLTLVALAISAPAQQPPDPGEQYIDTSRFLAHAVSAVRSHGFHRSDEEDATWLTALARIEQGREPATRI